MRTLVCTLACVVCCLALATCKKSPPADVAATVNGRPVTNADVEKQFQLAYAGAQERPVDEEMAIEKLQIVRSLVDSEIMLQRAEKLSLMATDADVEVKLNELRSPYTPEEFKRQLDMQKMTIDDLKVRIRRDLSINKLTNKEITSHISVTEKEISDFYNANKRNFNLAEPQIELAQIVVTAGADPVRNLKNDNAITEEQAIKKIQTIEARLRQGEDFAMVAQNFSEDPNSAPNRGDLGFINESSLQANADVASQISKLAPGQMSGIIRTGGDFRILKVLSREPAGQRNLNDPNVQQTIRERLTNRKDQLLREVYYEVARNEARVVNYYAQTIAQNKGIKK